MSPTDEILFSLDPERLVLVAGLYRAILGRPADAGGLVHYARRLDEAAAREVAEELLGSDEFAARRGGRSDRETIWGDAIPADDGAAAPADEALRAAALLGRTEPVWLDVYPDGIPLDRAVAYRGWCERQRSERAALGGPRSPTEAPPALSVVLIVERAGEASDAVATVKAVLGQEGAGAELVVACRARHRAVLRAALGDEASFARLRFVSAVPWRSRAALRRAALRACRGRFVARLEPGDTLAADMALQLSWLDGEPDLVTTDGDARGADGLSASPVLGGAAWDPDGVLAAPPGGLVAVRRAPAAAAGGFGPGRGEAHDWDLALRVAERSRPGRLRHLPMVGLHRVARGRMRDVPAEGPPIVRAHLDRTGRQAASVAGDEATGLVRVVHPLPRTLPRISVIVPTRDRADLLRACTTGLLHRTDYPDLELLIVDNGSVEAETAALFAALRADPRVRVLPWEAPFNWGAINNAAVDRMTGEIAVLLNNDTDVIGPGWLREMASHAVQPDVGAVGARLLYGDGTVQHAGIALRAGGHAHHLRRHARPGEIPGDRPIGSVRTVSAVTGACLAIRRSVFAEIGGIESDLFQVTWSDVDLCLKVRAAGYRVVWTPYAELFHLEQATRGSDDLPSNAARFRAEHALYRRRWGAAVAGPDPYLSPYLHPESPVPVILPAVGPALLHRSVAVPTGWERKAAGP